MILGLQENFLNSLLNEHFTQDSELYIGLGITQDNAQANLPDFTEPDTLYGENTGYSRARVVFSLPSNGIVRNDSEIVFPTANEDWTHAGDTISGIGIFKRYPGETDEANETGEEPVDTWELLCVLPLVPAETVLKGETVILNPNSITLQLTNRNCNC